MAYPMPIRADRRLFTGEDTRFRFIVYDISGYDLSREAGRRLADAATADGTAPRQDLSGFTLSYMIKRYESDPDAEAVVAKVTGDGLTVDNAAEGEGYVDVSAEEASDILAGRFYHHELKRTDVGTRKVLLNGLFVLNQAVHDAPEAST